MPAPGEGTETPERAQRAFSLRDMYDVDPCGRFVAGIPPRANAAAVVGAMAARSIETIADLQRSLHAVTNGCVQYKPSHDQLAKDVAAGIVVRAPSDDWIRLEEAVPRDVLLAEVAAWAKPIGVTPGEVHVRPMSRKWGSCSTNGRVTLNSELLSRPAAFRRRVIVEELLHLKVPNHGKLFRSLLRAHLGRPT